MVLYLVVWRFKFKLRRLFPKIFQIYVPFVFMFFGMCVDVGMYMFDD